MAGVRAKAVSNRTDSFGKNSGSVDARSRTAARHQMQRARRRPSGPGCVARQSREGRRAVSFQLLDEVALVALAVRAPGRDKVVLRHVAAASVRMGGSEMRRSDREDGQV